MAKRPTTAKKSVSAANLAALGADRLADLLMEAGAADPGLKRRLRMELAAEVGAADLALEIDKRMFSRYGMPEWLIRLRGRLTVAVVIMLAATVIGANLRGA